MTMMNTSGHCDAPITMEERQLLWLGKNPICLVRTVFVTKPATYSPLVHTQPASPSD